ncbi:uncharacterized protein [Watersipora subatra]|uniref:uncharacterized protein n=1 Tax=Watersipora subatra TaxID=2589382 RepID=UPI00355BAE9F
MFRRLLILSLNLSLMTLVSAEDGINEGFDCLSRSTNLGYWMEGPESADRDDAHSSVVCEDHFYAAECVCKNELFCDGTAFNVSDTRQCTAFKQGRATSRAVALVNCKYSEYLQPKVINQVLTNTSQPIRCPSGFHMVSCAKLDPWSHDRETHFVKKIDVTKELTCGWSTAPTNVQLDVRVSAMCIKDEACADAVVGIPHMEQTVTASSTAPAMNVEIVAMEPA